MNINSNEFANFLDKIIEQKVQKIVKEKLNDYGIMKGYSAIVTSVNGNLASVQLAGDTTTTLANIKNKSGQTLAVNDEVFLFTISSLSNAFIGVCKNKPA